MNVAVVGLGKVGHPLAKVLQKHFTVHGLEVSSKRYNQLCETSKYHVHNVPGEYLGNCGVIFVIVQTPSLPSGKFDLKYVEDAVRNIKPYLGPKAIIAVCSTINVGDIQRIRKHWRHVAYTPLMIAQGRIEQDLLEPGYVLIGSDEQEVTEKLTFIWQKIVPENTSIIKTSLRNMEIIKLTFNFWLPAKISLLNSTATFCEKYGGNYHVVIDAIKQDRRLAGPRWWNEFGVGAGIGFGGPCFPRDIHNWEAHLPENMLVKAVEAENAKLIKKSINLINFARGRNVTILGITYKAGTNLLTGSQAVKIVEGLKKEGRKTVFTYDPTCSGDFNCAKEAIEKSDIIFIAVPWKEFAELEPKDFKPDQIVIDAWRILLDKQLPCKYYAYGFGFK